jgi:hypothetical protein
MSQEFLKWDESNMSFESRIAMGDELYMHRQQGQFIFNIGQFW